MSKLTIHLMILCTILILWGIFMLYIHYKHKKRMKEIEEEWEERRRRWQQDRIDRQWDEVNGMWQTVRPLDGGDRMTMEEEINWYWQRGRRPAIIPYDELRPKTDKLSPKKKMGKHTMR